MKTRLLFLIILLSQFIYSNCPPGNVTFTSQTEVDDFVAQYPNCTQITGSLTINGFNFPNLNGLSNLTTVTGDFFLNITINSSIAVTGLQNITTVGGKLSVFSVGNLTNLDFLSGLTSVGGIEIGNILLTNIQGLSNISGSLTQGIRIDGCNNLTSLNGLQNITSVGGFITVINNLSLTDLTGLDGITAADMNIPGGAYNIWIFNNTNLSSLNGLHNLTTLTASASNSSNFTNTGFALLTNPSLTNISALANISNIVNVIQITNNTQLTSCAINSVCNKLVSNTTGVTINNNGVGCESIQVVQAACNPNPCPPGDVTFSNQMDVNNFVAQYPNCTEIQGKLRIAGGNINNLSGLSNLTSVSGDLEILLTGTTVDMSGLQNLTTVGGLLNISGSTLGFTNLDFLNALTSVGAINITGTTNLVNINGLLNITGPLAGRIWVGNNNNLISLSGLQNITSLGDRLVIINNPLIQDLSGLQGLTSVHSLEPNAAISSIIINANNALTSLNGLQNITSLTSVNPLAAGLTVEFNPALTDISSLSSNIQNIRYVRISNNNQLSTCATPFVCNVINDTNVNTSDIFDNAAGCQSVAAIQNECALSTNLFDLTQLSVYPVPFQNELTIKFSSSSKGSLRIIDVTGKVLISKSFDAQSVELNNLNHLSKGIYILQLETKNGQSTSYKIVK